MLERNVSRIVLLAMVVLTMAVLVMPASPNDKEPVRVTFRNSGPKYEFDNVERQSLTSQSVKPDQAQNNNEISTRRNEQQGDNEQVAPIGHIAIRRLFLMPIAPREPTDVDDAPRRNRWSAPENPFWPMMPGAVRQHVFGADRASRPSMTADEPEEAGSEESTRNYNNEDDSSRLLADPHRLMMEMLRHALSSQSLRPLMTDLNKDESAVNGEKPKDVTPPNEPTKPITTNETTDEIVEMDGQKYVRKSVISKYVGPGMMFLTRKLIYVPLNETDGSSTAKAPNSVFRESSTTLAPKSSPIPDASEKEEVKPSEAPVASQPEANVNKPVESSTTTSGSSGDKKSDPIEKEGEATISSGPSMAVEKPKFGDKMVSVPEAPATTTITNTTTTKPENVRN